eukprot:gnl/MRDRNA2_/MRDRNA2_47625_c0_seq1.p1 gnl/MRDRNA2_/MRDRNA2_47625_c0~~gnl/MRDRNA2_/MRDRNA2_47625_c0_seq1.p1  ORF type:complete len:133 (+),score=22.48 gnl/MRDRNA2_/MRDRNA2_47625_c0_seq1:46-444(+)
MILMQTLLVSQTLIRNTPLLLVVFATKAACEKIPEDGLNQELLGWPFIYNNVLEKSFRTLGVPLEFGWEASWRGPHKGGRHPCGLKAPPASCLGQWSAELGEPISWQQYKFVQEMREEGFYTDPFAEYPHGN